MSTYPNGLIPAHLLVRRGNLLLTAGTWAKWDDLVARVKRRTGVTLRITDYVNGIPGVGAYRDRPLQRAIKAYYTRIGKSWQAADEGTSSHGGEYKGDDALAIDVNNYGQIKLSVFFEEGRNAGFQMGYFDGNGKPYEPWHIIDRDPYRNVPAFAGESENDDMTPDERAKLDEVHSMLLEVRGALGAAGGHNMPTADTIGHKVNEMRDYLGAAGGKGTRTPDTIGYKITQLFKRLGS